MTKRRPNFWRTSTKARNQSLDKVTRQRNLQGMIGRIRNVADQPDRGEVARAHRGRASGVNAALVGVVAAGAWARNRWIGFCHPGQPSSLIAHVAHVQQVVIAKHALNRQVPILRTEGA